jgi:hypothetical protein
MRRSSDAILTTHVGALPVPLQLAEGSAAGDQLRAAVHEVVQLQRSAGVDFVSEGELTKSGNFVTFITDRLSGFEAGDASVMTSVLTSSQDWTEFADFYGKAVKNGTLFEQTGSPPVRSRRRGWSCSAAAPSNTLGWRHCSERSTGCARHSTDIPPPMHFSPRQHPRASKSGGRTSTGSRRTDPPGSITSLSRSPSKTRVLGCAPPPSHDEHHARLPSRQRHAGRWNLRFAIHA